MMSTTRANSACSRGSVEPFRVEPAAFLGFFLEGLMFYVTPAGWRSRALRRVSPYANSVEQTSVDAVKVCVG